MLCAVTGFGVVTIVFGLSTSFPLSMAMLLLAGMCDNSAVRSRRSSRRPSPMTRWRKISLPPS